MIFSFDIFDTCLVRSCGSVDNLLFLLAQDVLSEEADSEKLRDFVRLRKKAEQVAIEKAHNDAITIEEIYAEFEPSYYTTMSAEAIMRREMALDVASWMPVADVNEKINQCRQRGRVIFISDMYFSGAVIRSVLEKYELIKDDESLYVSSDYKASKYSGRLFEIVRQQEGGSYYSWTHYGDDRHNDYMVPRRLGIRAQRVRTDMSAYEGLIADNANYSVDRLSQSVYANVLRATRLSSKSNDGGFLADVMCGTIVPFVLACISDAQKHGLKRLYFASRDAYIMYLIARDFQESFPDMELRYLYVSTRTVYPALIAQGVERELRALLRNISSFMPKKVLDLLGFTEQEQAVIRQQIDIQETITWNSKTADKMIALLLSDSWKEHLLLRTAAKRELLMAYLKQEQFTTSEQEPVGLVDIGWRCSTQKVLASLLPKSTRYYYYGVSDDNFRMDEMGQYKAFYFMQPGRSAYHRFFEGYICRNLETTIVGYIQDASGKIVPRFEDGTVAPWIKNDFELRTQYLHICASLFKQYPILFYRAESIAVECSQRIFEQFSATPPKAMCRFLADKMEWDHYTDASKAIRKLYVWELMLRRLLPHNCRIKDRFRNCWLSGSWSYTFGTDALARWEKTKMKLKRLKR